MKLDAVVYDVVDLTRLEDGQAGFL